MLAVWWPILQNGVELRVAVRPQVTWVHTSDLGPGIKRERAQHCLPQALGTAWPFFTPCGGEKTAQGPS